MAQSSTPSATGRRVRRPHRSDQLHRLGRGRRLGAHTDHPASRRPPRPGPWRRPGGWRGARTRRPGRRVLGELVLEVAVGVEPLDHGVVHGRPVQLLRRGKRGAPFSTGRPAGVAAPGARPRAAARSAGEPSSPIRRQMVSAVVGHGRDDEDGDDAEDLEGAAQHGVDRRPRVGLPGLGRLQLGVGLADEPPGGLERQVGLARVPGLGGLGQTGRPPRPAGCRSGGRSDARRTWSRPRSPPGTAGCPGCWPGRRCSGR